MYGTLMVGKLRTGSADALVAALQAWEQDRKAPGHIDTRLLCAEDGKVAIVVCFESRSTYEELADDPGQDGWWNAAVRPLLVDEPAWIDGDWRDLDSTPNG
ncbi:MAG: hypothetical protein NVS3B21_35110 [Acidimicrobiales bacterium]